MAAALLFAQPFFYAVDADGNPVVGAKLTLFEAGSSTPASGYHDADLGDAWTQPIVTNAAGQSDGPIFVAQTPSLKVVVTDSDDVPLSGYPIDDVTPYALGA